MPPLLNLLAYEPANARGMKRRLLYNNQDHHLLSYRLGQQVSATASAIYHLDACGDAHAGTWVKTRSVSITGKKTYRRLHCDPLAEGAAYLSCLSCLRDLSLLS